MEEKNEITPQQSTENNNLFIPVKFNKEIRNITVEQASCLSQKGLKYDAIFPQWEQVRLFAKQENMTVCRIHRTNDINVIRHTKRLCRIRKDRCHFLACANTL